MKIGIIGYGKMGKLPHHFCNKMESVENLLKGFKEMKKL